jgi:hypothetical protein
MLSSFALLWTTVAVRLAFAAHIITIITTTRRHRRHRQPETKFLDRGIGSLERRVG